MVARFIMANLLIGDVPIVIGASGSA
jgi:hypothetical protein